MPHAHDLLAAHAHCDFHYDDAQQRRVGPPGYDSSDDEATPCSCHYHLVMIESLDDARATVDVWCEDVDGVCGTCWRSSCKLCDYVFDDPGDAPGFSRGRLICEACLPPVDDAAAAAASVYD